jgi:hypothetical protein
MGHFPSESTPVFWRNPSPHQRLSEQQHRFGLRSINYSKDDQLQTRILRSNTEKLPIQPNTVRLRKKCKIFQRENGVFSF